jgi:7,8-dihydropterin-6-yl-methyl-4-(beta-D-ribofuranosyl)aminobenzene 5'-phosphate synthase
MTGSIKIVSLVDNITYKRGLKAEHGLSLLIKLPDCHILFDTGQSDLLVHNARELGEDLSLVKHVVISHGHYDHAGGLEAFLAINDHATIWMKPQAQSPKFSLSTGEAQYIGMPCDLMNYSHRIRLIEGNMEIANGVFLLGDIPMCTSYETVNPKLKQCDESSLEPDLFEDEAVMHVIQNQSVVVIAGCAHRGIVNTLEAVKKASGMQQFSLVMGGTHLNGAPQHRITATTQALSAMDIKSLMPCHCTGIQAYHHLSAHLKCHVAYAQTGTVVRVVDGKLQ